MTARGALTGGEGNAGQLTSTFEDAASTADFDLYDDEVSFSDVSEQETLDQHAAEELRPAPIKTYSFVPVPGAGPMLFDDFDVGDIVSFRIINGAVEEVGAGRVTACTLKASDDGSEALTNLTMELLTAGITLPTRPPPPPARVPINVVRVGTVTDGSAVVTGLSDTSDMIVGVAVSGRGIPAGARVQHVDSPTQVTLDQAVRTYAGAFSCQYSYPGSPVHGFRNISNTAGMEVGMNAVGSISVNGNDPEPSNVASQRWFTINAILSSSAVDTVEGMGDTWYLGNGNIKVGWPDPSPLPLGGGAFNYAACTSYFTGARSYSLTFVG